MLVLGDSIFSKGFFILLIFCFLGMSLVSAATVSSPDVAKPGDTVSVYVGDLAINTPIKVQIDGQIKTDAGSPLSFNVRDLILPITLTNPQLTIEMRNLVNGTKGNLSIINSGGSVKVTKEKIVPANGTWKYEGTGGLTVLPSDTYQVIFSGAANRNQVPVVRVVIEGTTNNEITTPMVFSFNTVGFSSGIFNAGLEANDIIIDRKAFTIQDSLLAYR